ncbi:KTSC domain-containing protein [Novosphingobium sp. P6W]|jgi:hypothetical protein|uniref:KTSC domain-containing protein n=1 Tax=Novosphingobium sp. P6W TaxID=1609758 RepID=UPI0005C32445|nr:KTSC domain-containing protein [Novosphingobium sp. P6W]AXB80558.1 KTSC domain-containing protein [Novosphingobium sp. P6W]KIS30390.1 hypothetical protein TQ38_22870 [Novosphingobium sp. P6W]
MIDRISYDDEGGTLWVSFRQTGKYLYEDVPAAIFEAFCQASSAGTFFNGRVRHHFRCRRDPERRPFGPDA